MHSIHLLMLQITSSTKSKMVAAMVDKVSIAVNSQQKQKNSTQTPRYYLLLLWFVGNLDIGKSFTTASRISNSCNLQQALALHCSNERPSCIPRCRSDLQEGEMMEWSANMPLILSFKITMAMDLGQDLCWCADCRPASRALGGAVVVPRLTVRSAPVQGG